MFVADAACWSERPRSPRLAARKAPGVTAANVSSLEPDLLQEIVNVGQVHQHLTRLGSLVTADHAVLGELIDDPAGTRVADIELALHERHGSSTLGSDRARGPREQRIELALRGPAALPFRARALFEDLLHLPRPPLPTPEGPHPPHLAVPSQPPPHPPPHTTA